jgi:hypothetical protein
MANRCLQHSPTSSRSRAYVEVACLFQGPLLLLPSQPSGHGDRKPSPHQHIPLRLMSSRAAASM